MKLSLFLLGAIAAITVSALPQPADFNAASCVQDCIREYNDCMNEAKLNSGGNNYSRIVKRCADSQKSCFKDCQEQVHDEAEARKAAEKAAREAEHKKKQELEAAKKAAEKAAHEAERQAEEKKKQEREAAKKAAEEAAAKKKALEEAAKAEKKKEKAEEKAEEKAKKEEYQTFYQECLAHEKMIYDNCYNNYVESNAGRFATQHDLKQRQKTCKELSDTYGESCDALKKKIQAL